jgi:hypothetical protein
MALRDLLPLQSESPMLKGESLRLCSSRESLHYPRMSLQDSNVNF